MSQGTQQAAGLYPVSAVTILDSLHVRIPSANINSSVVGPVQLSITGTKT